MSKKTRGKRIMVIPDAQIKPDTPTDHIEWAAKYAVEKKPDVIVNIGDWADMPSLSSYDEGKKSFEGRRYTKDIEAANSAMDIFMKPIVAETARVAKNKKKRWDPRLVFTLGNHEHRIERAIESDAKLEGLISYEDFNFHEWGWEVYPFLEVVVVEGVAFSHYFTSGVMGRPVSSARAMLNKKHMSSVMGHVQDRDIAFAKRADGRNMTGLFVGIFYSHDEDYLTPQTNGSWSGIWMLHEVEDGSFDEMAVSMSYLENKYGK